MIQTHMYINIHIYQRSHTFTHTHRFTWMHTHSLVYKKLQGGGRGLREAQFLEQAASHPHLSGIVAKFSRYNI